MFSPFLVWAVSGFIGAVVVCSFLEWVLHRYIMHRPLGKFVYPYRAHTLTHHRVFRADKTYHLVNEKDMEKIAMAWWNGPVLIAVAQIPMIPVAWLTGQWGLLCGTTLAVSCYYGAYEYLHWCMHLPKQRRVERSGIFFRLNGHHLLHHRYMNTNYNVVFPLADWVLGTLLLRSKVSFAQARGPAVPDVQPLAKAA